MVGGLNSTSAGFMVAAVLALLGASACATTARSEAHPSSDALVLQAQGSFAVGGTVVTSPGTFDARNPSGAGGTLHGDHAYVFYQVPIDARPLPLVFWHGAGQSKKTWETTVDGREGFQKSIAAYNTILIGSPIWSVRAPRIMLMFAEHFDFTGKKVHPFTTYAMSGLGQ
jgi:hypothetical protein